MVEPPVSNHKVQLMAYCMSHTIVKSDGERMVAHPLRCRCWTCEKCAPYRRSLLVKEAKAGKPRTFITLTSNPASGPDRHTRAQALVDAWRHIVRQLRARPQFARLQYMVVIEKTAKGEPHLHILARMPYLSQKWLSEQMRLLVNAPIVDIRQVKNGTKIAEYVTKYIGKDPARFDGCKRYWRSFDYMHPTRRELREQRDPDMEFYYIEEPYELYRTRLLATGWHIDSSNTFGTVVHAPPWEDAPPLCNRVRAGSWETPRV